MIRLFRFALLALALAGLTRSSEANLIVYVADLSGPNESPPNASPGTGTAVVQFDSVAHTMRVQVTFSGLLGTTTASHIHSPTAVPGEGLAGVATQVPTFSGFPLGVTSGTYDQSFDTSLASFYNPAFVTANGGTAASAEAALAKGLSEGRAYLNIHSSVSPGGEIRGFLRPQVVPEPSSFGMAGTGVLLSLGYTLRRRRRTIA